MQLLSNCYQRGLGEAGKPWKYWLFWIRYLTPTRQANPDFNCFCLGDLTRRNSVWFPLSSTHGVCGLLLSKSYQRRCHRPGLLELFTVAWTINRNALPVWYMLFIIVTIAWNWPDFNAFIIEKLYEIKWNRHAAGPAKERTSSVKAHGKEGL